MSLIKKNNSPRVSGTWLSNFFDNDMFFDSNWLRDQSLPAVNIKESDKGFDVELAAPGLSKKDFKIDIDNHVLTISSQKEEEKEEKGKNFTRQEFSYNAFSRSFSLPESANEDDLKATYEDGVLKLHVGKKKLPQAKAKKAIEIQ